MEQLKCAESKQIAESYSSFVAAVSPSLEGRGVATVVKPDDNAAGFSEEKIRCPSMPRQVRKIALSHPAGSSEAPEATMYVSKACFHWSMGLPDDQVKAGKAVAVANPGRSLRSFRR
ncbi:hypothetical protein HPB50_021119 [Hyalomma asiaticum]|uniref:Uncharacterized protein n=1 Tax=Hyalomma asiaticum TaxID=266040 RepID=A0ACB7TJL5_HYAAI|nr:hypothetical protein HPB50_021119 [Hyalomma asiaticum]